MKTIITIISLLLTLSTSAQHNNSSFITADINNFWTAYDKIITTKDSAAQYDYINRLFIDKGTPGLKAMMRVRRYNAKSYVNAINKYPLFWNSLRPNTLKANNYAVDIANNISKLKALYHQLKPAKVYFTVGTFRSGGTTLDSMVLIGSEISLADASTITTEFPESLENLKTVFRYNTPEKLIFNNIHEYVHTQQKTTIGNTLLATSVLEGVAEFVAEKATTIPSALEAISYGKLHDEKIKPAFAVQMFNSTEGFWLYSNEENKFGVRDLGYYVGYAICQSYYNKAQNKEKAIKTMIELDYNNEALLMAFTDKSGYFNKPLQNYKAEFENNRPIVTGIKQFTNNATDVSADISQITIEFSTVMDKRNRNFELGPLGKDNLLIIKSVKGFSDDGKSLTFETVLQPGRQYQILIGDGFRNKDGVRLKPYLLNFKTNL